MITDVDFYYDYVSPYSYLAYTQRRRLEEAGAALHHRIFFLGGLMGALGSTPPIMQPGKNRPAYLFTDILRWARYYGVPLQPNPTFPMNTLLLLRGAGLARREGLLDAYSERCFRACWAEGIDVGHLDVGRGLAEDAGLSGAEWADYVSSPLAKAQLKADTEEALDRGVFGAPTFFVGDEQFFGNDRLHFVLEAVSGAPA